MLTKPNKFRSLLIVFMLMLFVQVSCAQKQTKIWIVRHAEKVIKDLNDKDPGLTTEGLQRSIDLATNFKGVKIDAIFSTKYQRNRQTASPLAKQKNLAIQVYDAKNQQALADSLKGFTNKNYLIVGHSNTVLELIEAFGIARPLQQLSDDDYDYLFEVNINKRNVTVKTSQFGAPHHRERTHE